MTKLTTNPPLYFDTDCLSAFLWIENESILTQLYPGRVMIPKQVYDELGSVPHLQGRIDTLLGRNEVELLEIEAGTPAAELYAEMTGNPRPGHAVIGRGEAASLALSKIFNGIVASNNLRDITQYIEEYQHQHKTNGANRKLPVEQYAEKAASAWGAVIYRFPASKRALAPCTDS